MPKEKKYNPVQEQRKAEKARAIKKGKSDQQERRNEQLARRNPERLQKQIDDLKAIATGGEKLTRHEEQMLATLEKELKAVKRARETLGDKAPSFGRGWDRDDDGKPKALGKRRRGPHDGSSSDDDDIPEDVKRIPMPRDTPPPIPKDVMDKWYAKRRARREAENASRRAQDGGEESSKKEAPVVESKTVYEAAPVIRDLRKEAVSAFVPTAVQMKMKKVHGQGGLLEPEEADRLEQEGYLKSAAADGRQQSVPSRAVTMEDALEEDN
ncbi:hypothetical protein S40293_01411 [Stachybotrys chartarum IBT 40293]|nr:hypothetical protein S40293_01411 [Stachybotrys chartarum IBT 40293]